MGSVNEFSGPVVHISSSHYEKTGTDITLILWTLPCRLQTNIISNNFSWILIILLSGMQCSGMQCSGRCRSPALLQWGGKLNRTLQKITAQARKEKLEKLETNDEINYWYNINDSVRTTCSNVIVTVNQKHSSCVAYLWIVEILHVELTTTVSSTRWHKSSPSAHDRKASARSQ